jgi:hypothetical protein
MRRILGAPLLLALLWISSRPAVPELAPASPEWPALFLMDDGLVDISRTGEFEAGLKDLISALKGHDFPFGFDTYATDDGHFYRIYGLKNFADVDRWVDAWQRLGLSMGQDKLMALQRRLAQSILERRYKFWRFRPDISFLPEQERLKPEQIGYYTWDFVWIAPGMEDEFEALNRDWIALNRAKRISDPFLTYAGDLGTASPVYVWFEYGKSAADYAAAEEEFWKTLGDQGAALSKRTRALIRKRESKTGRYRTDLSYAPG